MTGQTVPAASQVDAMREALAVVEAQMLEGSADGRVFHQLRERRERMQAELQRLEMLARREAEQAHLAHLAALRERVADARTTNAKLAADDSEDEAEFSQLFDRLEALIARCRARARAKRACASQERNGLDGLKREGEPLEHPRIGWSPCPTEATARRGWVVVHDLLDAGNFNPHRAVFMQTTRR